MPLPICVRCPRIEVHRNTAHPGLAEAGARLTWLLVFPTHLLAGASGGMRVMRARS